MRTCITHGVIHFKSVYVFALFVPKFFSLLCELFDWQSFFFHSPIKESQPPLNAIFERRDALFVEASIAYLAGHTTDCTGTLRAGTSALKIALDAIKAGSARNVLVVAADCRMGAPKGEFDRASGDGAAALLVGGSDWKQREVKDEKTPRCFQPARPKPGAPYCYCFASLSACCSAMYPGL